ERSSESWREYPEDVLPLFVAETDCPLAPAITAALERAVRIGDTGYVASRTPLAAAYAGFTERRFGWTVDPRRIRTTADVSMGIVEILRRVIRPRSEERRVGEEGRSWRWARTYKRKSECREQRSSEVELIDTAVVVNT